MLAVFASVLLAVPSVSGAQSGGLEVELPPNTDCRGAAVIAKATVVEDAAAANMLAEALRALSPGGDQRCLLDAGNPSPGARSSAGLASAVYVVGGPSAVPDAWLAERFGVTGYVRVAGADRWQTQQSVAAAILALAHGGAVRPFDPASVAAASLDLPPNGDCYGTAVLAKLTIAEERAAANMLATALTAISGDPNSRCLVDVGLPGADRPPTAVAVAEAAQASGVYLLGGTAAVPQAWIDNGFDIRFLERISGPDRWATQAAVAEAIIEIAQGGTLPHQYRFGGILYSVRGDNVDAVAVRQAPEEHRHDIEPFDEDNIAVHYCAHGDSVRKYKERQDAHSHLVEEVAKLNLVVSGFFRHQSGNNFNPVFVPGEITAVGDELEIDAENYDEHYQGDYGTYGVQWNKKFDDEDRWDTTSKTLSVSFACSLKLFRSKEFHDSTSGVGIVLVDQGIGANDIRRGDILGYAYTGAMQALVPLKQHFDDRHSYFGVWGGDARDFYYAIAHEMGHGWLSLSHPHDISDSAIQHNEIVFEDLLHEDEERTDYPWLCGLMSYCTSGFLTDYSSETGGPIWIACGQRKLMGWPDGPDTPYGVCRDGKHILWGPSAIFSEPAQPGAPSLKSRAERHIRIDWSRGSSGAVGYEVQWRSAQGVSTWKASTQPHPTAPFGLGGLDPGTCYEFRVRAGNIVGWSSWSPTVEFCTTGIANLPTLSNVVLKADSDSIQVDWSIPSAPYHPDALANVKGFKIEWDCDSSGSGSGSAAASDQSFTIDGLSPGASLPNGRSCKVRVAAVGPNGEAGTFSDWENVTVGRAKPTGSVWISDGPVNAARTASGSCSGRDCHDLRYTISGLGSGPYATECWFNGRRRPDRSFNWSGNASTGCYYSAAFAGTVHVVIDGVRSNTVTVAAKQAVVQTDEPDRVGRPAVTAGDGQVTVSWTAPASNGAPILEYDVFVDGSDASINTGTSGTLSTTVPRLTNGVTYEVQVRARNSVGWGDWSLAARATPEAAAQPPDAPNVSVSARDGQLVVSWDASSANGSPVTGYTVSWSGSDKNGSRRLGASARSFTVPSLTNGAGYTVSVVARSAAGNSAPASLAGFPKAAARVPDAPRSLSLEAGDGQIKVSWLGSRENGAAVTGYVVAWTDGVIVGGKTLSASRRDYTITNLSNGSRYDVEVVAKSRAGTSPAATGRATPEAAASPELEVTVPCAPRSVSAVGGDGWMDVSWSPPSRDGCAAVSGYVVEWSGIEEGSRTVQGTSIRISRLSPSWYSVHVAAVNSVGRSEYSEPPYDVMVEREDTGLGLSLEPGDRQIVVSWDAARANGSPVTGYVVTWSDGETVGGVTLSPSARSYTITGLSNGVGYNVGVAAQRSTGTSTSARGRDTPRAG